MKRLKLTLNRLFCKASYEFYLYEGNKINVNKDMEKLQEKGWEIAGEISVKFGEHGVNRILIPLKRRV